MQSAVTPGCWSPGCPCVHSLTTAIRLPWGRRHPGIKLAVHDEAPQVDDDCGVGAPCVMGHRCAPDLHWVRHEGVDVAPRRAMPPEPGVPGRVPTAGVPEIQEQPVASDRVPVCGSRQVYGHPGSHVVSVVIITDYGDGTRGKG